jgi:hypothetical protein
VRVPVTLVVSGPFLAFITYGCFGFGALSLFRVVLPFASSTQRART